MAIITTGKGKLRTEILDKCPEEFFDDLSLFIDDIEEQINNIITIMNITSISELDDIDSAYTDLNNLSDSLY